MHVITRQFFSLRHRQRCGTRNQDPEFVAVMARVVMLIFHLKLWHLTMVTDDDDREREKKHRINRKFNYYILWVSAGSHRIPHPTRKKKNLARNVIVGKSKKFVGMKLIRSRLQRGLASMTVTHSRVSCRRRPSRLVSSACSVRVNDRRHCN